MFKLPKRKVSIVLSFLMAITMLNIGYAMPVKATSIKALPIFIPSKGGTIGIVSDSSTDNTLFFSKHLGGTGRPNGYTPTVIDSSDVNQGGIRLTDQGYNSTSTVDSIVRRSPIMLQGGFSTYFQTDIHDCTNNTKADGLCFVLYDASNGYQVGESAGGLGYGDLSNGGDLSIKGDSVAVELDTYLNAYQANASEIPYSNGGSFDETGYSHPHIAIDTNDYTNGSYTNVANVRHADTDSGTSLSTDYTNPTLDNGSIAHAYSNLYDSTPNGGTYTNVWVDMIPDSDDNTKAYVIVTYGPNTDRTSPSNYSIKRKVSSALLNKSVYVGFSASTGGNGEYHDLIAWYFSQKPLYDTNDLTTNHGVDNLTPNIYTQAATGISVDASSNTTAKIQLLKADGSPLEASENINISIDGGTASTVTSTDEKGCLTYDLSGVTTGSHTITVTTSDGSAQNTANFYRVNAAAPVISGQPSDKTVNVGDTAELSVIATATGTLSYQWYSNTSSSNTEGSAIEEAKSASYSAPTSAAGTTYYYCVVTNTDDSVSGTKTATVTSSAAKVEVDELTNAAAFTVMQPTSMDNGVNDDGKSSVKVTWTDSATSTVDHYEIVAKEGSAPTVSDTVTGKTNIGKTIGTASFDWNAGDNLYVGVVAVDANGLKTLCTGTPQNVTVASDGHTATALVIDTTNPPTGTVGVVYSGFNFDSTGGTGTKSYEVTSGSLPAGLSLAADGTLTGTPTTTSSDISFTVTVTDSAVSPVTDSHTFTMTINAMAKYSLNYKAGPNGTISGTAIQTVNAGTIGTAVTAIPNPGYHFTNWSDSVATATRIDRNVQNNINVTAFFAVNIPTPQPTTEVVTVPVTDGTYDNTISKTEVQRTTNTDGTKKDDVQYTAQKAQETVDALKSSGKDTARIVIPDVKDEVSEAKVGVPTATINILAVGGISLEIDTENARITVPKEAVKDIAADAKDDLYFRVVPIKAIIQQQAVEERAKQEEIVQKAAGSGSISVVGRPMTIETNMKKTTTAITLPLKNVTIPANPAERDAFLKSLAVFIEHSDGTKELLKGEITEYKSGIYGIKFTIHKYSTFTIIKMDIKNSTISPATTEFNKNTSKQADVNTTMTLNGNTLSSIVNESKTLVNGTDYEVKDNVVTIKKSYLAQQNVGTTTLTFNFNTGNTQDLVIAVKDTTIKNSTINPITIEFDKNTSKQVNVNTTMTLNGNTLTSIVNGSKAIVNGTDYEIKDNIVTIKKNYLALQSVGTTTLNFNFSDGNVQNLVITVKDTTPSSSGGSGGGGGAAPVTPASAKAVIERLSGQDRVDTALAIAKAAYTGKISKIILTSSENYPDALAGSVLAHKLNAPILLVGSNKTAQEKILTYLKDNMDTTGTVYILGGIGAISKDMEAKITASGFKDINRLGGADRYETNAKLVDTIGVKQGTPIVIVSGENYPDSLSISSIAAVNQYPILMVNKNEIPEAIKKEISLIKPSKVCIIGEEGAVSAAVEDQVSQTAAIDKTNIVRIGGVDRFETSLKVIQYFGLSGSVACVASGNNFPDALAGSIYAANNNTTIMLIGNSLTKEQKSYLKNAKIKIVTILGGEGSVSKDIEDELTQILK